MVGVTTGAGEYAPMPPELGPRSPSSRALWSCEVGRRSSGAESAQARRAEGIDHAFHQWYFGADDGEIDIVRAREGRQFLHRVDGEGDVLNLGLARGAGVAGCDVLFVHARRLRCLPGKGVLAAAATDDQHLHDCLDWVRSGGKGYRKAAVLARVAREAAGENHS